jgi:hypothetical protein
MTLFWRRTGPRMRYEAGMLHIQDLNPEARMQWRMSRWEIFMLGMRCLCASVAR